MITVAGLGPAGLDRVPENIKSVLLDPERTVIARTERHPAARELAGLRPVDFCDHLYEGEHTPEEVYRRIVERVVEASTAGPVVYAVPGSPLVGEFAARRLIERGVVEEVLTAESFLDAILLEVGYDPLDRGLQILDGHNLPSPLALDKPTVIAHLSTPQVLAEVCAALGRVLPEEAELTVLVEAASPTGRSVRTHPDHVDPSLAGDRTSLFIDTEPGGLIGVVHTMRRLRQECPWDREQTHQSLVKNLIEESYELVEAISRLDDGDVDWVRYSVVEDELGDVLLQVLFHASIARQAGAFDIDDVAEVLRRKLVRRHPHVFGSVEAGSAGEVKANWDRIKEEERGDASPPDSALTGVPAGIPALQRASKVQNRAAKVGFDWDDALQVLPKLGEELAELESALGGDGDVQSELGDLLFSAVNLSRHLGVDPELALRRAVGRFEDRFRRMEAQGPLQGLDLEALDERWEQAKGS